MANATITQVSSFLKSDYFGCHISQDFAEIYQTVIIELP